MSSLPVTAHRGEPDAAPDRARAEMRYEGMHGRAVADVRDAGHRVDDRSAA
ncbi:hypothetical protein [Burkholderia anthina]|uniref:Uncharacterized protein n=1 Tax=Burkholderia anthina TaxID=179879 RepID=A0A6P2G1H5_9BURK|nr:hypothetical protein [Burkholderia anthina]MBM2771336.1 hypothetical protein [Burkholderia anthina]VVU47492.1 hypothetical protein BAN20980_00182 [Burkholderia anthina]